MEALSPCDPCSFSRPDLCVVKHIDLDLAVNFAATNISGVAHLTVEKKQDDVGSLVLDASDLKIGRVTCQATGQELSFTLGDKTAVKAFGSKLEINLPSSSEKQLTLSISYETSPSCSALQWLRPEQTAGKRQPYLFSQCQAIHARSLYPCQDSPAVKFTYTAKVKAPREITILMSAVRLGVTPCEGDTSQQVHNFEQKVPIPSYLMAIVGGDLESRDIGPRSKVWSERELVDKAAYEFAETEVMLQTAEALMGTYEWGQYDLLVLPPSFPFGGMENPCLTFVTPTLLAGDRSLADVVAHEISHSWTGNLVTNNSPQNFWLNEGFTKYLERAIVCRLGGGEPLRQILANAGWCSLQETCTSIHLPEGSFYFDGGVFKKRLNEGHTVFMERKITSRLRGGEPLRNFLANEGWKILQEGINSLYKANEGPYTKLIPDLRGVDPDDAFSVVPYEKGFALLYYLETLLGGPAVFEEFLKAYISHFKFQSISTQQWKDFLFSYFSNEADQEKLKAVDWDTWFYAEGMPPFKPQYDLSLAVPCQELSSRWLNASDSDLGAFSSDDLKDFSSLQTREFLSLLLEAETPLSVVKLERMEAVYHLNEVRNSEVRFKWLRLCIKGRWKTAVPGALQFVTEQGRMKFVRPIYRDLYQWEEVRQAAIDNFLAHKAEMHNTTAKEVAKDLHLSH